jgi:hypothetical protein
MLGRIAPNVRQIPRPKLGVIGWTTFSMTGGVISALKMGGCIVNVTRPSLSLANITMSPAPLLYTVAGSCTNAGSVGFLSITTASFVPSSTTFQVQPIQASPLTGYDAPQVFIFVFGEISRGGPLYVGPKPLGLATTPMGVIGATKFSLLGAALGQVSRYGCAKQIVRTGVGNTTTTFFPSQGDYGVVGAASSDAANASYLGMTTGSQLAGSSNYIAVGISPLTGRDAGIVDATIIGPKPKRIKTQAFAIPGGDWDVIGLAKYNVNNTTISNVRVAGCVQNVIYGGTANYASIVIMGKQLYTWAAIPPTANAAFMGWNASSPQQVNGINIVPVGISPTVTNPASNDVMVTIFGPTGPNT